MYQCLYALEIYYLENGSYPSTAHIAGGTPNQPNSSWANSAYTSWENLEAIMGVDLPKDPINNQTGSWPGSATNVYNYTLFTGIPGCGGYGSGYILVYRYETKSASAEENAGVTRCDNGNKFRYTSTAGNVGRSPLD